VYAGSISKFSGSSNAAAAGEMVWDVFGPASRSHLFGVLAGPYSAAVRAGGSVLVGGNDRAVSLQPVPFLSGANFALGVTSLTLSPAR
jgi:hypothetical protein